MEEKKDGNQALEIKIVPALKTTKKELISFLN